MLIVLTLPGKDIYSKIQDRLSQNDNTDTIHQQQQRANWNKRIFLIHEWNKNLSVSFTAHDVFWNNIHQIPSK